MFSSGLLLFLGLLDTSSVIEDHLLRVQVAEIMTTRKHWVNLTAQVMKDIPSTPKSFECWNIKEGYKQYIDSQAWKLKHQYHFDSSDLVYIITKGKFGTVPNDRGMRGVNWDLNKTIDVIKESAEKYQSAEEYDWDSEEWRF